MASLSLQSCCRTKIENSQRYGSRKVKGEQRMQIKIERLTPGKYWKGPEPFGCFNTGHAPIIWRPARLDKFYLVGDEVLTLYPAEAYSKARAAILKHCMSFEFHGQCAWVFWTRKAAERQFNKLIQQRVAELK